MLPHRLRILTKFSLFVKKKFWLFSLGFLGTSLFFSFGIIIGANIISRPPMIIEKQLLLDIEKTSIKEENAEYREFSFVASSRGKYYYPIDCSLADTLKEENKIYFKTRQEAERGGYIYNIRCD